MGPDVAHELIRNELISGLKDLKLKSVLKIDSKINEVEEVIAKLQNSKDSKAGNKRLKLSTDMLKKLKRLQELARIIQANNTANNEGTKELPNDETSLSTKKGTKELPNDEKRLSTKSCQIQERESRYQLNQAKEITQDNGLKEVHSKSKAEVSESLVNELSSSNRKKIDDPKFIDINKDNQFVSQNQIKEKEIEETNVLKFESEKRTDQENSKEVMKKFLCQLEELGFNDVSELNDQIEYYQEDIDKLQNRNQSKAVQKAIKTKMRELTKLKDLHQLYKTEQESQKELMQNEFLNQLAELGFDNVSELSDQIEYYQQVIEKLENRHQSNAVQKAIKQKRIELTKLKDVQKLYKTLDHKDQESPLRSQETSKVIRTEFLRQLDELGIKDVSELNYEINFCQEEIKKFENRHQSKAVQKAIKQQRIELTKLKDVQKLYETVEHEDQESSRKSLLEKLTAELKHLDLEDVSEVPSQIEEIKSLIADLEKVKQTKRRLESIKNYKGELQKLESVCSLSKRIQDLEAKGRKKKLCEQLEALGITMEELPEEIDVEQNAVCLFEKKIQTKKTVARLQNHRASLKNLTNLLIEAKQLQLFESKEEKLNKSNTFCINKKNMPIKKKKAQQQEHQQQQQKEDQQQIEQQQEEKVSDHDEKKSFAIRSLYETFQMPSCFERCLIRLLSYVSLKSNEVEEYAFDSKVIIIDEVLMQTEFKSAVEYQKLEKVILQRTSQVEFNLIPSNIVDKNLSSIEICIAKILKEVRPFDIQLMHSLVKEAEKAVERVRGREVLLLLGFTGAGKSTTIHYLAGSTMELVKQDQFPPYIAPQKITNPALKAVEVKPSAKSVTRFVTAVPMKTDEGFIVLCDSPGFDDTKGPEVDLANSIGLVKAIRECKSVKPLILISNKSSGDRGQGIKKLAHTLVDMIPNVKDYMRAFSYGFTKYPDGAEDFIHGQLRNILKEMTSIEKDDDAFRLFLKDMVKKTERKIHLIDPLDGNPSKILSSLMEQRSIKSPKYVFQTFLTERTREKLQQQVLKIQSSMLLGLNLSNFELVMYRLNQLKMLIKEIGQESIQIIYNQCVNQAVKAINAMFDNFVTNIDNCLKDRNILTDEALSEYRLGIQKIKSTEILRREHLKEQSVHSDALRQNIINKTKKLLNGLTKMKLANLFIKVHLDKIAHLVRSFPEIEILAQSYQETISLLTLRFKENVVSVKQSIQNADFDQVVEGMTVVKHVQEYLAVHIRSSEDICIENAQASNHLIKESPDVLTLYDSLQRELITYLQSLTVSFDSNFEKSGLSVEVINSLDKVLSILASARQTVSLEKHIEINKVDSIYEGLLKQVVLYFQGLKKKVEEVLVSDTSGLLSLKTCIQEMKAIRKIPVIESRTNRYYYASVEQLCGFLNDKRRDANQMLTNMSNTSRSSGKMVYEKLECYLSVLKDSVWVEEIRPGLCSGIIKEICCAVNRHGESIKSYLIAQNLGLSHGHQLERLYKETVLEIDLLYSTFKNYSTELEILSQDVRKSFEKSLIGVFNIIQDMATNYVDSDGEISSEQSDGIVSPGAKVVPPNGISRTRLIHQNIDRLGDSSEIQQAFVYLGICQKIPLVKDEANRLERRLRKRVKDYACHIDSQMNECVNFLESVEMYSEKEKIFRMARLLLIRMKELDCVKRESPQLFKYFNSQIGVDIVDQWLEILSDSFYEELYETIRDTSTGDDLKKLQVKILVLKSLICLDPLLKQTKYTDLYQQYRDHVKGGVHGIEKRLMKMIEDQRYEGVNGEMSKLKELAESHQHAVGEYSLKQAKNYLQTSVEEMLEESLTKVTLMSKNIEIDQIQSINSDLRKIREISRLLYIERAAVDQAKDTEKQIKELLSDKLCEFIHTVDASIGTSDFYEAGVKMEYVSKVQRLLGKFCPPEVSKRTIVLNDSLVNRLNKIVGRYSRMRIDAYVFDPPKEIFERFKHVSAERPEYDRARAEIRENILTKFQERIKSVANVENDIAQEYLLTLKLALETLPDEMKNHLKIRIQHAEKSLVQNSIKRENEMKHLFEQEDLAGIERFHDRYIKEGNQSIVNKIVEGISEKINVLHSKATESLEQKKVDIFVVIQSIERYQSLSKVLPRITVVYQGILSSLYTKIIGASGYILRGLSQKDFLKEVSKKGIEENFSFIMAFINAKVKSGIVDQKKVVKAIDELHNGISEYLQTMKHRCDESLSTLDFLTLSTIMETIQASQSFFIMIRSYVESEYDLNFKSIELLVIGVKSIIDYSELVRVVSVKVTEKQQYFRDLDLMAVKNQPPKFYEKLQIGLTVLYRARELGEHVDTQILDLSLSSLHEDAIKLVRIQVKLLIDKAQKLLPAVFKRNLVACNKFNVAYTHLVNMMASVSALKEFIDDQIQIIKQNLIEHNDKLTCDISTNFELKSFSAVLIKMKFISNNIYPAKEIVDEKISLLLTEYRNTGGGNRAFTKLAVYLSKDSSGIGKNIISNHSQFKGYSVSLFNTKIQKHGFEYVLKSMTGNTKIKTKILRKLYEEWEEQYRSVVKRYLESGKKMDLAPLIAKIKMSADIDSDDPIKLKKGEPIPWDDITRSKIPELMAHISALWTLKHSKHFFEAGDVQDKDSYLIQPHAAQVISIFRMLNLDYSQSTLNSIFGSSVILEKNLIEVGTGEGKSIILAITAIVLALFGMNVSVSCYSAYLSERDSATFKWMFDLLGVFDYIHYGTFNWLAERRINAGGDLRERVLNLVCGDDYCGQSSDSDRPEVLLIDEVDVFFKQDFYGSMYTPSCAFRDPVVTALANYVWEKRGTGLTLKQLKDADEYKSCCAKLKDWDFLIEEAAKDMIVAAKDFEAHDYIVHRDKICYMDYDTLTSKIVFGYNTLFAYYKENAAGNISEASLQENISLKIYCGRFSYAEIPHQFNCIMGVTGTLKILSNPERAIVHDIYNIKKETYIPSIYGAKRLIFNKNSDVIICNKEDYFNRLRNHIDSCLVGRQGKRAVMVFFESQKKLDECYQSEPMAGMRDTVLQLTESVDERTKNMYVQRATTQGQVTFLTRGFGRGTNFICDDEVLANNGGCHVIQAFLSEELGEEVQIQGRTARQGGQGSFSLFLLQNELEKFSVSAEDIDKAKDVYEMLNKKRNEFFKQQYQGNVKYVESEKEIHCNSMKFVSSLNASDVAFMKQFLAEQNKGAAVDVCSKTVCLMDATASMTLLLQNAKHSVATMFNRALQILKEHGFTQAFEMQFVVYRNYNAPKDQILEASTWESKPENLRRFMDNVEAGYGWGNEAIELGLWHVNKCFLSDNISQVILIGDAAPNTAAEVKYKRSKSSHGENYWLGSRFGEATTCEAELTKINIPVHCFYVHEDAKESFTEIANKTKGESKFLNVNHPKKGCAVLTDLVTETILKNIGGADKGDELVKAYQKFKAYC